MRFRSSWHGFRLCGWPLPPPRHRSTDSSLAISLNRHRGLREWVTQAGCKEVALLTRERSGTDSVGLARSGAGFAGPLHMAGGVSCVVEFPIARGFGTGVFVQGLDRWGAQRGGDE